jgi:hypothetical protein
MALNLKWAAAENRLLFTIPSFLQLDTNLNSYNCGK